MFRVIASSVRLGGARKANASQAARLKSKRVAAHLPRGAHLPEKQTRIMLPLLLFSVSTGTMANVMGVLGGSGVIIYAIFDLAQWTVKHQQKADMAFDQHIPNLRESVQSLVTDVGSIKETVQSLVTDVGSIKETVQSLVTDVGSIKYILAAFLVLAFLVLLVLLILTAGACFVLLHKPNAPQAQNGQHGSGGGGGGDGGAGGGGGAPVADDNWAVTQARLVLAISAASSAGLLAPPATPLPTAAAVATPTNQHAAVAMPTNEQTAAAAAAAAPAPAPAPA